MNDPRPTRTYRSPLRAEKAAETRRLIATSAGQVFSERGYAGTTMAQIADRAGVSVESVHGLGTKPALLIAAFKQMYSGESGWKTILDEPDLMRIMSLDDTDEAIRGYAEFIADANSRSRGIWPAVRTAALSEPQVAEQIEELITLKKRDFVMGVDWYISRGIVSPGTDPLTVAPFLYVLTSQETYDQLIGDWGHTIESYTKWLTEAVRKLGVSTVDLPSPASK
ncbi:TetR/AcrR family transcriptional regulator [Aeromicrobium sp. P5_D10]